MLKLRAEVKIRVNLLPENQEMGRLANSCELSKYAIWSRGIKAPRGQSSNRIKQDAISVFVLKKDKPAGCKRWPQFMQLEYFAC